MEYVIVTNANGIKMYYVGKSHEYNGNHVHIFEEDKEDGLKVNNLLFASLLIDSISMSNMDALDYLTVEECPAPVK